MPSSRPAVILLPGAMMPAAPAYADLLVALGDGVDAVAKDLEVYAGDTPPTGYELETEIDGVLRAAAAAGFDRFHLVGYSGGAAVGLVLAATHPARLLSLTVSEPAWSGNTNLSVEEREARAEMERVMTLPPDQQMREFVRLQLRDSVEPPPRPPADPPWMAKRPAGIAALSAAFGRNDFDRESLRSFIAPVLSIVGGLSHPIRFLVQAEQLAAILPSCSTAIYADRHHFDPPHRAEPERMARDLRELWALSTSGR